MIYIKASQYQKNVSTKIYIIQQIQPDTFPTKYTLIQFQFNKAQKGQVNNIFPSIFWVKKRPYFQSPKN